MFETKMILDSEDLHHLRAAHGYADLGMYEDAEAELDRVSHCCSEHADVLAVRLAVHGGFKRWGLMRALAKRLQERDAANPQWPISRAYATRRAETIEAARVILLDAAEKHPGEAMIRYNLACYECQLGHLDSAKEYIHQALVLAPGCRALALEDSDLVPLRDYVFRLDA